MLWTPGTTKHAHESNGAAAQWGVGEWAGSRLEAITTNNKAIASSRLEAITSRLEAISSRLEAQVGDLTTRLEAIGRIGGHC